MRKRILSLLLAVLMMASLLPISALAAERDEMKALVAAQYDAYLASLPAPSATDTAMQLANHSGGAYYLDASSDFGAGLLRSRMMRSCFIDGVAAVLQNPSFLTENNLCIRGTMFWYDHKLAYGNSLYAADGEKLIASLPDADASPYTAGINSYDEAMILVVGNCLHRITLHRTSVTDKEVRYKVELEISDRFDFNVANYEASDAYLAELLTLLGKLMSFGLLSQFDWTVTAELELTVPNLCSHESGNYLWCFDKRQKDLVSVSSDGWNANPLTKRAGTTENGVFEKTDYLMSNSVRLLHDRPWVLEIRCAGQGMLSLASASNLAEGEVYLRKAANTVFFGEQKFLNPDDEARTLMHYGVWYGGKNGISAADSHTYRLENCVNTDGSNMVYLFIDGIAFGAMENYYQSGTNMKETSDWVSGRDFVLNHIGSSSALINDVSVDFIRVWENGEGGNQFSYCATETVSPTCETDGYIRNQCQLCGGSYASNLVPALGHSYGEYVPDNNPGCVEDATETRTCTRCGEKDSVAIPDTALGHSYGEYVFDNNASCTEDGTQTRKCTVCGEKDAVTAPDTATGHSYEAAVTEPTYTEQGYTTYTCTVCGDSYKDNYVDVKKHSYVGVVTEPTCTAQGFTTYTCSECGDSYVDDYTDMIAHTPVIDPAVKPTCSEKGKTEGSHCGVCGYVIKKQALISTNDNHTMEESIVKMPTYDEPGQLAYICTGCGKTDYVEIPPLNKPLVNPFTDVTERDWFFEPVLWAVENKVTGGKTETTFAPNEGCTRAQVVTFLWAANGKPEPTSENPFTDVANDAWYLKPVLWAVENGITTGVTTTEFGPDQTCTRAQIATFLWAANGKPAVSGKSEFTDVADTDWYAAPIIWAKENDVTGGIGDGKFGPNDTCTRAQVVTFLKKVYANK